MADKKISALTSATTPLAGTEDMPLVQSGTTKKVAVDDLTVKNIRAKETTGILQVAGPAAAATRTMTVPDENFEAARKDAGQTFVGDQSFNGKVDCDEGSTAWLTGQTLTLTRFTVAEPFTAILSTNIGQYASTGTHGLYLITRIGTQNTIAAIVNDANLSVTVSGSNKVEITNVSGGNRTIYAALLKLF